MKRRRSPQEKKRLSYSKDRRNAYGENDKASRKNIARNKRLGRRAQRHLERQQLAGAVGRVDERAEEAAEQRLAQMRSGARWRKCADAQLGVHVQRTLVRRVRKGISSAQTTQTRIEKVRRSTTTDGRQPPL